MTTDEDIKRIDSDIRDLRRDVNSRFDTVDMRLEGITVTLKEHGEGIARIDERSGMTNKIGIALIVAILSQFIGMLALYRKWI